MSACRILSWLVLATIATGCTDAPSTPSAPEAGPHFLQWSGGAPDLAANGVPLNAPGRARLYSPPPPVVVAASNAGGSTNSLSWTHNGGSGANRLLLVSVSLLNPSRPVTEVTFQGTALDLLGAYNNSDNSARVELWYLVAPPTGSGSVVVKTTAADRIVAGAQTFGGVDPTAPFRPVVAGGSATTSTHPTLVLVSAANELVADVVVVKGEEASVTVGSNQTQRYKRAAGEAGAGAGSTEAGAPLVTMSWTRNGAAKWAAAAVAIRPVPLMPLTQYQAEVWLVRGQTRSLQLNYLDGSVGTPFMRLSASDPTWVPGRGALAVGDSVLVKATVDPNGLAITLEPHGLLFGTAGELKIWYGGAGGDLNGDGVVDATDAFIEAQLLGLWYQALPGTPWSPIPANKSVAEKSFTTALWHFSGYSVAW